MTVPTWIWVLLGVVLVLLALWLLGIRVNVGA